MPAVSKKQQRFMGMVHAVQKGDIPAPSPAVAETASNMSPADARDFAATKQTGLPEQKKRQEKTSSKDRKMASQRGRQRTAGVSQKWACDRLQDYLQHLALKGGGPLHVKQARAQVLTKLSSQLNRTGDLWQSLSQVFPTYQPQQRFKLAQGLVRGLRNYLQKSAMGSSCGSTSVPQADAGQTANKVKQAPSSSRTMPASVGMKF